MEQRFPITMTAGIDTIVEFFECPSDIYLTRFHIFCGFVNTFEVKIIKQSKNDYMALRYGPVTDLTHQPFLCHYYYTSPGTDEGGTSFPVNTIIDELDECVLSIIITRTDDTNTQLLYCSVEWETYVNPTHNFQFELDVYDKLSDVNTNLTTLNDTLSKNPITWDTWAFRQRYIQNNVAGGSFVLTIAPSAGEKFKIENLSIRPTITAAETVVVYLLDENAQIIRTLWYNATVATGDWCFLPSLPVYSDDAASTVATVGIYEPVVTYPNIIQIQTSAVAQNDLLEIVFNVKIQHSKGTVVTTGSGGTVAVDGAFTNDYDKVI